MAYTGRGTFVSVEDSYHGNSVATLSIGASHNREARQLNQRVGSYALNRFWIISQLRDFLDRPPACLGDLGPAWISSRSALRSPRLLATQIPEHCIHCDVPGSRVEQHCALRAVSGRCSSLLNGVGGGLTTFREISLQDERRHVDSLSMPRDCNDPGHHQIK